MDGHAQLSLINEISEMIGNLKSDVRYELGMSLLTFSPVIMVAIILLCAGCSRLHDRLDDIENEVRALKRDLPSQVASGHSVERLDENVEQSAASINRSFESVGSQTQMAVDRLAR
jgi:hypothetical protein